MTFVYMFVDPVFAPSAWSFELDEHARTHGFYVIAVQSPALTHQIIYAKESCPIKDFREVVLKMNPDRWQCVDAIGLHIQNDADTYIDTPVKILPETTMKDVFAANTQKVKRMKTVDQCEALFAKVHSVMGGLRTKYELKDNSKDDNALESVSVSNVLDIIDSLLVFRESRRAWKLKCKKLEGDVDYLRTYAQGLNDHLEDVNLTYSENIDEVMEHADHWHSKVDGLVSENIERQRIIDDLFEDRTKKQFLIDTFKAKLSGALKEIANHGKEMDKQMEEQQRIIRSKDKYIMSLKQKIGTFDTEMQQLKKDTRTYKKEKNTARNEVNQLKSTIKTDQKRHYQEIKQLKSGIEKDQKAYHRGIESVMEKMVDKDHLISMAEKTIKSLKIDAKELNESMAELDKEYMKFYQAYVTLIGGNLERETEILIYAGVLADEVYNKMSEKERKKYQSLIKMSSHKAINILDLAQHGFIASEGIECVLCYDDDVELRAPVDANGKTCCPAVYCHECSENFVGAFTCSYCQKSMECTGFCE